MWEGYSVLRTERSSRGGGGDSQNHWGYKRKETSILKLILALYAASNNYLYPLVKMRMKEQISIVILLQHVLNCHCNL